MQMICMHISNGGRGYFLSNYNGREIDEILDGPVFKFLELIEQMPEEIILMGPSSIFSWLKENITDPTLMAALEQIIKEHPELNIK